MGISKGLGKQPNMIFEELSLRKDTKITTALLCCLFVWSVNTTKVVIFYVPPNNSSVYFMS